MERYLSFEIPREEVYSSVFADYILADSELLPNYFGDIAPVNIFLGENNSGKSRFMRGIMKCNPTRVFDINEDAAHLRNNVSDALEAIELPLPETVFDIDISVGQSTVRDEALLALLSIPIQDAVASPKFEIRPSKDVEDLVTLLKRIEGSTRDDKLLMDMLISEQIHDDLKIMQGFLFSLRRAASIYETLANSQKLKELGFNLNSISKQALFISANAHLSFVAKHLSTHFNSRDYRKQVGEEASSVLRCIINASEPIIDLLTRLSTQKSESRIRTYIPTLRTARTLTNSEGKRIDDDMMHSTIIKDYELIGSDLVVNTGLSLFTAIDNKRSSNLNDREEFKKFEAFLSETFFNGKLVEVVPSRKNATILVSVDREERALPYLGDGIQAIILLLYPLFTAPEGAWFFIEEPETHLHPGFQRLFIKTIATHKVLLEKKLTIFLTTHSNHLLDFAIDEARNINLFTFRKLSIKSERTQYQIQFTAPNDLNCLTALGVQNSSVFLSNCTIWVEGITDRIYLKAYLKAYIEHKDHTYSLLEGLHYSFLEYAGSNVSHYTFGAKAQQIIVTDEALKEIRALSISNRIMLIADQDSGKETRHEQRSSQQHAGFEYVVLPTREIENLLSPEVIVGALKKLYYKQAQHFDGNQLKQVHYKTNYLAKYLQGKFPELPNSFVGTSGTVSSDKKRQFAEAAAEVITSWEMLSPDAKELTERVFKFIMGHNPRLGSN